MGLGSFASLSVAQGLTERIVADIVRTDESPVIDGLLDDAAWAGATVISDLH